MELSDSERKQLIDLLKDLEEFSTEQNRRTFLRSTELRSIVANIDLSGQPFFAITRIIDYCEKRGYLDQNRNALGIFLRAVQPYIDYEKQDFIEHLLLHYGLNLPMQMKLVSKEAAETYNRLVWTASPVKVDVYHLSRLLLACPSMSMASSRNQIVDLLPTPIKNSMKLGVDATALEVVINIIQTCLNYPDGMTLLLYHVGMRDKGTKPFDQLETYLKELIQSQ
jgi:hypothetical protein